MSADKLPKPPTAAQEHRQAMRQAVHRVCDAWPEAILDISSIGFPRSLTHDGSGGSLGMQVEISPARGDRPAVTERIPATSVELAAIARHDIGYAVGWVSQLHDVVIATTRAAWPTRNLGIVWDPDHVGPLMLLAVAALADQWTADRPGHHNLRKALYELADTGTAHWPPPAAKGTTMGGVTVGERTSKSEKCGLCQEPIGGGQDDPIRRIDGQAFHKSPCWYTVTVSRTRPEPIPVPIEPRKQRVA